MITEIDLANFTLNWNFVTPLTIQTGTHTCAIALTKTMLFHILYVLAQDRYPYLLTNVTIVLKIRIYIFVCVPACSQTNYIPIQQPIFRLLNVYSKHL